MAAPDFKARVGGPGAMSQRTDKSGNQPVRVATGQPYGSAKQQESLQQAVSLPQDAGPQGGPAGLTGASGGVSGESTDLLALLGGPGTMRPDEPINTFIPEQPDPKTISSRELVMELEQLIQSSPGGQVPEKVLQLYYDLRDESNVAFGAQDHEVSALDR